MLSLHGVSRIYRGRAALSDVSFDVGAAGITGLVGPSGSGKSTVARCVLGLERPDRGAVRWFGRPMSDRATRRHVRREIQAVFQDPRSSLDPRWTVRRILSEPLDAHPSVAVATDRAARLGRLLDAVSLSGDLLDRYPHELSTGQCQRVCIARAFAPGPRLIVLDEPLSALDVLVQSRILDLLFDLHRATGVGYLLITHDFGVVREICDRVVVLDGGRVVETGATDDVLDRPGDPRTRALLGRALSIR